MAVRPSIRSYIAASICTLGCTLPWMGLIRHKWEHGLGVLEPQLEHITNCVYLLDTICT